MRRTIAAAVLLLASCGKHRDRVIGSPHDAVPITITTIYPGASPAVIADSVTTPIERQLGQAANLSALHSRSTEGRSVVIAEFAAGTAVDDATREVQKALNATSTLLPQDLPTPPTYTRASRSGAVMRLIVVGDGLATASLAQSAREIIAPKLGQVAGVGNVEICGPEDETRITINSGSLAASGRTIDDVRTAIVNAAAPAPLTRSTDPTPAYQDIPIVRDTAHVEIDKSVSSCVALGGNGRHVIGVTVTPQVGADPLEVRERLESAMPAVAAALQAMKVQVWSRTRPLAYEILLDSAMGMERRIAKLERAISQLQLSGQSLLQLGLSGRDPDIADLRIAAPADHVQALEASLASVFEQNDLTLLDRNDHIVGFSGVDMRALRNQRDALVAALANVQGLRVVQQLGGDERPQHVVTIDRDRAAKLGVTTGEIATTLRVLAPGGMWVSTWFYQGGQQRVMLAIDDKLPDVLARVMVRSTTGDLVPLSTVGSVTETREPAVIFHEGQFPWIGVRVAGPLDALQDLLAKLPIPADIRRDVREPD